MRIEGRMLLIGLVAVAAVAGADQYVRSMAPYYAAVARAVAAGGPWEISGASVASAAGGTGSVIRLTGTVRRTRADAVPAAVVVAKLHAGAALQLPLIYWTIVLASAPLSRRHAVRLIAAALPAFLLLEAASTVAELLSAFADTSRALAGGAPDALTPWAAWAGFLEGGGRIALAAAGALMIVGISLPRRARAPRPVRGPVSPRAPSGAQTPQ